MLSLVQAAAGQDAASRALERAREGDQEAFAELIRLHQSMVFSLARHFLRSRSAAEDLAQDVFLELHTNLTRLDDPTHVKFWLRRVTSHRCIDRLRRPVEASLPDTDTRKSDPSVMARDVILEERLRRSIGRLPARPRMVVILKYQEDLDPGEIAGMLDMPLNTVKSHLRRSLAVLRRYLKEGTTP